jgi:cyclophilin family peptidyl-prolyl cis-trans isomerase
MDVVDRIANVKTDFRDKPAQPVVMKKVYITD